MSTKENPLESTIASDVPTPVENVISHIMTPGSSLSPTFLLLLDCSLGLLLSVFVLLLAMSRSLHFVALILIELGLWASVKLYVSELRKDNEASTGRAAAETSKPKQE